MLQRRKEDLSLTKKKLPHMWPRNSSDGRTTFRIFLIIVHTRNFTPFFSLIEVLPRACLSHSYVWIFRGAYKFSFAVGVMRGMEWDGKQANFDVRACGTFVHMRTVFSSLLLVLLDFQWTLLLQSAASTCHLLQSTSFSHCLPSVKGYIRTSDWVHVT
jgi:hypothetical protein